MYTWRSWARAASANISDSIGAAEVDLTADELVEIERIVADGVSVEGATPEGVD
ncbi:hypothetical protein EV193_107123 [Herbihabitans rhizosphaerae]|uniref:Aldo/keto reductase family protein n=1 Tax=Herbihabitans rhizosphaerae TaxID=1872711 RepID=A0A4Q7KML5_9PSEU|nr:hypothetical protein [Herbihabitans rhizosphaerae]RZS36442.1 hypothetical protein EV193_107123 [Herbihabitans rhizosphaerae]